LLGAVQYNKNKMENEIKQKKEKTTKLKFYINNPQAFLVQATTTFPVQHWTDK